MNATPNSVVDLVVRTGCVRGQGHDRDGSNCQDSVGSHQGDDLVVLVVSDGCSDAASSEVGATLLRAMLLEKARVIFALERALPHAAAEAADTVRQWLETLFTSMVLEVRGLVGTICTDPDTQSNLLRESFLATLRAIVIRPDWTIAFSCGDGITLIGDALIVAEQFNYPRYLAYAALPAGEQPGAVKIPSAQGNRAWQVTPSGFALDALQQSAGISRWLVATDGALPLLHHPAARLPHPDGMGCYLDTVGPLTQFFESPHVVDIFPSVQARLNVLVRNNSHVLDSRGQAQKIFEDDAAIALARYPADEMVATISSAQPITPISPEETLWLSKPSSPAPARSYA